VVSLPEFEVFSSLVDEKTGYPAVRFVSKSLCHAVFGGDVVSFCLHACRYCYTRQLTRLKWDNMAALPMATGIYENLPRVLDRLFSENPVKYPFRWGMFGNVGPPYEATSKLFRECLRVHLKHEWPVIVFTKVPLHYWVADELLKLAERGLLFSSVTITSFDPELVRFFEPRAPDPEDRARFIEWCEDHRIPWSVRVTPVYQGRNDSAEGIRGILSRLPRGHVIVEYLRVEYYKYRDPERVREVGISREEARDVVRVFAQRGVGPWEEYPRGYRGWFTVPAKYALERVLEMRSEAGRLGFSFAMCGHYVGFKIQDYRDCCTGRHDWYMKFSPHWKPEVAKDSKFKKLLTERLPRTPLMLFKDRDKCLITGDTVEDLKRKF
jgi:DNA repair photolyase